LILDNTHPNKKQKQIVRDLIGKPFSFFETIKLGRVVSKQMLIEEASPNLQYCLNIDSNANYATIQLRSDGILIDINKSSRRFTWIIPYYQLVIYKTNGTSIHAQGKYIHFKNDRVFKKHKDFFDTLFNRKVKYDERFNFQF